MQGSRSCPTHCFQGVRQRPRLTAFFNSAPGTNFVTFLAGIFKGAPVCGLRPVLALRELTEETGIAAEFVSVEGFLDVYETVTGYAVLPVVGLLSEGFALAPDAIEVAQVFEVPLAFFLDPANRREHVLEWKGGMRRVYAFEAETHYIWGATASMLVNLAQRLSGP